MLCSEKAENKRKKNHISWTAKLNGKKSEWACEQSHHHSLQFRATAHPHRRTPNGNENIEALTVCAALSNAFVEIKKREARPKEKKKKQRESDGQKYKINKNLISGCGSEKFWA